jgi:hypothetical protein
MSEADNETLRGKLADLLREHRNLDAVIDRLTNEGPFDQLQIQRLKKRKLMLKDEIKKLESQMVPNIIA